MAQNLLEISHERLRMMAAMWKMSTLKSVKRHLHEYKWEKGKYFSDSQMQDIELRQTIIDSEINKKVNFNEVNNIQDFTDWERKMNFKKRVF